MRPNSEQFKDQVTFRKGNKADQETLADRAWNAWASSTRSAGTMENYRKSLKTGAEGGRLAGEMGYSVADIEKIHPEGLPVGGDEMARGVAKREAKKNRGR